MEVLLDDDGAAAAERRVFISNQNGVRPIEALGIGGAIDKAQRIARIDITKA